MEEKIYDRQVTKESLSKRVVDHEQIGRHYTASDLAELFVYSPKPPSEPPFKRPTVSPNRSHLSVNPTPGGHGSVLYPG